MRSNGTEAKEQRPKNRGPRNSQEQGKQAQETARNREKRPKKPPGAGNRGLKNSQEQGKGPRNRREQGTEA